MFWDKDAPLTVVKGTYIKMGGGPSDHPMKRKWNRIGNDTYTERDYPTDYENVTCESMCEPGYFPSRRITEPQMLRYLEEEWCAEMKKMEQKRVDDIKRQEDDIKFWKYFNSLCDD